MVHTKRFRYLVFLFVLFSFSTYAQNKAWFYLTAKDTLFNPSFKSVDGNMVYAGNDSNLKTIFAKYKIDRFKKTWKTSKNENLKKTFFVIADKESLLQDLLQNAKKYFVAGKIIPEEARRIFEPNDYGLTSTIGDNKGMPANLDYLDYLEVPKAWYYTTGSRNTIIGLSDATVDTTNIDFKGKIKVFQKSSFSNGHGTSIASIAAGQGNNNYGVPGVCYDCSIFTTRYGFFSDISPLMKLSKEGARVINCSWVGITHNDKVQAQIDTIFRNGTILVAASGNTVWSKNKGAISYYPASYNHVISVGSGMYKYETPLDHILIEKNKAPYAANIRGYVGRTMGFKDLDTSKEPHIWPVSITSLNKDVDILAPSVGLVSFYKSANNTEVQYITREATSPTAPLVTGTIGLMFSLYPCLPVDEVESILKMTSTNIDDIPANKPYAGNYGSGMLNTGRAVEMVFDMFSEREPVKIENQDFSRWDFKLTSLSEVIMKNQKFTDAATLALTSKKKIVIAENTILKPGTSGKIHLKINPSLKKECELQLRDPSILEN